MEGAGGAHHEGAGGVRVHGLQEGAGDSGGKLGEHGGGSLGRKQREHGGPLGCGEGAHGRYLLGEGHGRQLLHRHLRRQRGAGEGLDGGRGARRAGFGAERVPDAGQPVGRKDQIPASPDGEVDDQPAAGAQRDRAEPHEHGPLWRDLRPAAHRPNEGQAFPSASRSGRSRAGAHLVLGLAAVVERLGAVGPEEQLAPAVGHEESAAGDCDVARPQGDPPRLRRKGLGGEPHRQHHARQRALLPADDAAAAELPDHGELRRNTHSQAAARATTQRSEPDVAPGR